ncbi:MAG: hypothetical protein B6240_05435 [Desulfobacteraceae bacterium 4572_87]|nr:MAG: hypothetical protein B6240_05435 [Desulfobacteraceae bacterium 4572_87]
MSPPPDSNHIVHFFLDLYRLQMGLPEPDPRLMSAHALADPENSKEITYELKVTHRGRNNTRRMSLCRLGDDVVSKSTCYKVIYDDLLVLKIPPEPVDDFDQYLKSIELEHGISNRLSPEVACVSPSLTAILKKNPEFRNDEDLSQATYEEIVTRRLKQSPSLQRYLKIGGTFVLFMSLSKHRFFDQVISQMHEKGDRISNAIAGSHDTMNDILAFGNAYGEGKDNLFFSFMKLQHHYLLSMDQLLQQHGKNKNDIPEYQKKQWMFHQLAGKKINDEPHPLPEDFILDRKRIGKQVFSQQKKAITQFIQLIQTDIQNSLEHRNRHMAGGIVSNFVELLFHLKEKNAAIRDLKPDNMFLVGNSDNPDTFLASAENYSLGLIDLETSVNLEKTINLEQPILAGTPFFATPSHIFENHILEDVFGDAPHTLYLQDWFAAVGIIYNVVTGKILFEKTGQLLWEVVRVRSKAITTDDALENVLKNTSWVFWHTACAEFREKITSEQSVFKDISLSLGATARDMIRCETLACEQLLLDQIERCISDQSIFKGDEARQSMHTASAEKIAATLKKWRMGKDVPETTPEIKNKIIVFLRCLTHLKKCQAALARQRPLFQENNSNITAQHLIFQLFRLVFFFMYRPEWTQRKHPESF